MRLLYWNLKANKNESYIAALIRAKDIDIGIFSEYSGTDFSELTCNLLNGEYELHQGYGACEKVILVSKKNIIVDINREQSRYIMYSVRCEACQYIIVGIHLPSNPNSNSDDRKMVIRDIVADLKEQESHHGHKNSIIIGDFNASPFDEELVEKDAFNAVLYRDIIEKKETVTHQGKKFRLLYNPALHYISENDHQYGSFYYTGGIKALYWYCFDQILMTKSLLNSFRGMCYCRTINGKSLLKNVRPNESISDHLPLIAEFERSNENE